MLSTLSSSSKDSTPDRGFWQLYRSRCDFYICKGVDNLESLKLKYAETRIKFIENEEDCFSFGIVVTAEGVEDPLMFPLDDETPMVLCFDEVYNTVDFLLQVDEDLTVMFKFQISEKDFTEAGQFREIVGRLMYQVKYRKAIIECEEEGLFNERMIYREELNNKASGIRGGTQSINEGPGLAAKGGNKGSLKESKALSQKVKNRILAKREGDSEQVKQSLLKFMKQPGTQFGKIGRWGPVGGRNAPEHESFSEESILLLQEPSPLKFEINIFDRAGNLLSRTGVTEGLNYNVDLNNHRFSWVGFVKGEMRCFEFRFRAGEEKVMAYLIPACQMQLRNGKSLKKMGLDEKSSWSQFYMRGEKMGKRDQGIMGRYIDEGEGLKVRFNRSGSIGRDICYDMMKIC